MPRALLVGTLDCSALALYADQRDSHAMARFDLGPFRLFRPDHDQQFTSESGRIWRPVE